MRRPVDQLGLAQSLPQLVQLRLELLLLTFLTAVLELHESRTVESHRELGGEGLEEDEIGRIELERLLGAVEEETTDAAAAGDERQDAAEPLCGLGVG